tara:strand:+ start:206 stop:406 length:201 start_codon:yes stop_codon:yes gene_type:complete
VVEELTLVQVLHQVMEILLQLVHLKVFLVEVVWLVVHMMEVVEAEQQLQVQLDQVIVLVEQELQQV